MKRNSQKSEMCMQILFTLWLSILIPAPDLKYVVTKHFTAFHAIYDVAPANGRRFSSLVAAEGRLARRNVCGSQVICDAIYRKIAIICPGLNNFVEGFRRAYKPGQGGLYSGEGTGL